MKRMTLLSSYIKTRLLFVCFVLAMAVTLSTAVQAEDQGLTKTVVVMGTGTIYKNDSAGAREAAISNSLVSAVDRVALDLVPLETIVRTFKTINEIIFGQTDEFIQGYKVLAEFPAQKKYRVMVEATVSTLLLEEKLKEAGFTLGKKAMPKILLLVSEQTLEDQIPKYWWRKDWTFYQAFSERALADTFNAGDFTIIELGDFISSDEIDPVYDKPDLNDQDVVNLGTLFQADVVIIGKSFVHQAPNVIGTDIRSFKGTVTARAIRTDTGTEIASASQNAVTANSDEITGSQNALTEAGILAAKELALQITAAWQQEDKPLGTVAIMLEGTGHIANFVKFRNVLQDMPGVKEMQIEEMKPDQATIMISFQGTAKELANALILKTFESIGINIYEVSENHLRIELIPG